MWGASLGPSMNSEKKGSVKNVLETKPNIHYAQSKVNSNKCTAESTLFTNHSNSSIIRDDERRCDFDSPAEKLG